ncbi:MAG: HAMP domain-containing histidine kinase, partial [Ktedonobacteraceae bacterium]|nr:HAMP domain-containing histidine kinase [Ktedonobacteraceae bacterium]
MAEIGLQELTRHARDVLDCSGAGILLQCADPSLRHPLLNFLPPAGPSAYYSDNFVPAANERLAAICDMVLQSGHRMTIECLPLRNGALGSMIAVPLERPAGLLGLLLLWHNQPTTLSPGENQILDQYMPFVTRWLEELLVDVCDLPFDQVSERQPLNTPQPGEFVSMVSHELRVPLSAIKGYAALLQAYGSAEAPSHMPTAQRRQYLDAIMAQVGHLETLVDDLLDMSRVRTGQISLRCERIDVARICHDVARLTRDRVEQSHPGLYRIHCVIDHHLPLAWADPDRVQQVLTNLIENAIKYSPQGGLVEIIARARRTMHQLSLQPLDDQSTTTHWKAYITVRDWGIGIPPQMQSSLFKPFKRLEHPLTMHVAGNGLGLYI